MHHLLERYVLGIWHGMIAEGARRYPKNPVLRLLTPQDTARNMIVYPVKLESEAILVNVGSSSEGASFGSTRGGAGTSSAGNNIYALQPQTYVQGNAVGDTGMA